MQGLAIGYAGVVVSLTVLRFAARKRLSWWWDDLFAAIGMVTIVLQCIVLWLWMKRMPSMMVEVLSSIDTDMIVYYLNNSFLYLQVWMARLSILGTIIRIAPSDWMKDRLKLVGGGFLLVMIGNGIMLAANCEHWQTNKPCVSRVNGVPIYRILSECNIQWDGLIAKCFRSLCLVRSSSRCDSHSNPSRVEIGSPAQATPHYHLLCHSFHDDWLHSSIRAHNHFPRRTRVGGKLNRGMIWHISA
jgi:hypothetical protein